MLKYCGGAIRENTSGAAPVKVRFSAENFIQLGSGVCPACQRNKAIRRTCRHGVICLYLVTAGFECILRELPCKSFLIVQYYPAISIYSTKPFQLGLHVSSNSNSIFLHNKKCNVPGGTSGCVTRIQGEGEVSHVSGLWGSAECAR